MPIQISFVSEQDKDEYKQGVLNWLSSDFLKQGSPRNHFWHNAEIISEAFNRCEAMVALNDKKEIVGYMIWSIRESSRAEIEIVEVKEAYRQRGIFKEMLSAFSKKFAGVILLSVSPLPESVEIFNHLGWENTCDLNGGKKCFKMLRPVLPSLNELPNGHAIAVASKTDVANSGEYVDYFKIKFNPSNYQMKYFQIDMNKDGYLSVPVITPFHYDGYIGIYFDKELITDGKSKFLFKNSTSHPDLNLLAIDRIEPLDPKLSEGFFSQVESPALVERPVTISVGSNKKQNTCKQTRKKQREEDESDQPQKRQRVECKSTFFQLSKSVSEAKIHAGSETEQKTESVRETGISGSQTNF